MHDDPLPTERQHPVEPWSNHDTSPEARRVSAHYLGLAGVTRTGPATNVLRLTIGEPGTSYDAPLSETLPGRRFRGGRFLPPATAD